ncbi:MAG: 50S ribosomal protein L3 N(5)-glutamine methyltransferase [Pseudomonadota bacterium]
MRDFLRYTVTQFERADLVYGHGTETALDEAAFLILSELSLPIDQLEPWLDARLTMRERQSLLDLIETRIVTRKPAPYLIGQAFIQGYRFHVDEGVIVPRSFLGELLAGGLEAVVDDADDIGRVLDLCTGSGCLAIIAADQFPHADVVATDISDAALAAARKNVEAYDLAGRVTLQKADLFDGLDPKHRFDLIVCNPPYVRSGAVSDFPPEYAAEPALAHDGGQDGLDLVHRVLANAADFLTQDGILVVEIGQERDAVEAHYPGVGFWWLDTAASSGEVFAVRAADLSDIKAA